MYYEVNPFAIFKSYYSNKISFYILKHNPLYFLKAKYCRTTIWSFVVHKGHSPCSHYFTCWLYVISEFYKRNINSLSKKDKSILVQTFVQVLLFNLIIFWTKYWCFTCSHSCQLCLMYVPYNFLDRSQYATARYVVRKNLVFWNANHNLCIEMCTSDL